MAEFLNAAMWWIGFAVLVCGGAAAATVVVFVLVNVVAAGMVSGWEHILRTRAEVRDFQTIRTLSGGHAFRALRQLLDERPEGQTPADVFRDVSNAVRAARKDRGE